MKRWFAAILALLLYLGSVTLAEPIHEATAHVPEPTPKPEPTFLDSFIEWMDRLNPEQSDINASLALPEDTWSMLIRRDGGVVEVAITDTCRLQLTQTDVAFEVGNEVYVLDLQPLLGVMQHLENVFLQQGEEAEIYATLLRQAVEEILLPSAEVIRGFSGVNIHFELDRRQLAERLRTFVSTHLTDRTFNHIFAAYVQTFQFADSSFPGSAEEMLKGWEQIAPYLEIWIPRFAIEVDVQADLSPWRSPSIACVGYFAHPWGRTGFSISYAHFRDGFSFSAGVDDTGYGYRSLGRASLDLDLHGQYMTGTLMLENYETVVCSLEATLQENGVTGEVTCRQSGVTAWVSELDLWEDTQSGIITGTMDLRDYSEPEPVTLKLITLKARYWESGCSGTLMAPVGSVTFRVDNNDAFSHVTAKVLGNDRYDPGHSLDLWLFMPGMADKRIRCEYVQTWRGRSTRNILLEAEIGPTELSFSWDDRIQGTSAAGALCYVEGEKGFDFRMEFIQDEELFYRQTLAKKVPFLLEVSRNGGDWRVSYSNMSGMEAVRANAVFVMDDSGSPVNFKGEYERVHIRDQQSTYSLNLDWRPGTLVITDRETMYTFQ
ncbi:MAG: hypothetical protein IJH38_08870, partial [Clostridia bacterium]|nr:hypothetical protein [Clostridia bacterium]